MITCMVEIFIFTAALIGVINTVWKTGISQIPQSHSLASQISRESEGQPNYFNRICSFSRKKKNAKQKQII